MATALRPLTAAGDDATMPSSLMKMLSTSTPYWSGAEMQWMPMKYVPALSTLKRATLLISPVTASGWNCSMTTQPLPAGRRFAGKSDDFDEFVFFVKTDAVDVHAEGIEPRSVG